MSDVLPDKTTDFFAVELPQTFCYTSLISSIWQKTFYCGDRQRDDCPCPKIIIGRSKGGARDMPPGDPNSFIFMQFSAKSLKNNPILGVVAPLRKILDPPLIIAIKMKQKYCNVDFLFCRIQTMIWIMKIRLYCLTLLVNIMTKISWVVI